jgi:mercuric ion binding protein
MEKKMKNFKYLLIALSLMAGFVSTQTVQAKPTEQTQNNSQSVVLDVQNMTCAMCPITIRKALQGVDGVQSAKVDFASKTANVIFNPKKTNIETLIKTTTNVGYPATIHSEK